MNNLKNLRKKRGYSIKQLHEMTGIPVRSLEDWDAEKRQIQAYHRIKALSEVLNCDMDDLMTKEEKCLYDGKNALICLVQVETGVNISVYLKGVPCNAAAAYDTIIPRESALELLGQIKNGNDIKNFLP